MDGFSEEYSVLWPDLQISKKGGGRLSLWNQGLNPWTVGEKVVFARILIKTGGTDCTCAGRGKKESDLTL